jgi:hypothetical protein
MRNLFKYFRKFGVAAAFSVILGLLACGQAAHAANPLEMNFWLSGPRYDGNVPPCEYALNTISAQFAEKESKYWNSSLLITGYADVHEVAYRPWAYAAIPRRFCSAHAMLSDGRARQVHYSIVEDGGLAGYGPGVEFCVAGLDRNWAYNPSCKAARQ